MTLDNIQKWRMHSDLKRKIDTQFYILAGVMAFIIVALVMHGAYRLTPYEQSVERVLTATALAIAFAVLIAPTPCGTGLATLALLLSAFVVGGLWPVAAQWMVMVMVIVVVLIAAAGMFTAIGDVKSFFLAPGDANLNDKIYVALFVAYSVPILGILVWQFDAPGISRLMLLPIVGFAFSTILVRFVVWLSFRHTSSFKMGQTA